MNGKAGPGVGEGQPVRARDKVTGIGRAEGGEDVA